MQILKVIPIKRGIFTNELTYFSPASVEPGAIVSVPIRGQSTPALVVNSTEASLAKTELKKSDYQLRKIEGILHDRFFLPQFIAACQEMADYAASWPSQVISTLVPAGILEKVSKIKKAAGLKLPPRPVELEAKIVQAPDEERFSIYRSLIREAFARNQSVILCLPTIAELSKIMPLVSRGLSEHTFFLHGKLPKKELIGDWQKITRSKHPVLVIATPLFLSLPLDNLGVIIIENESASYKQLSRPYLDLKLFARKFSEAAGAKLILGDSVLSLETLLEYKNRRLHELSPLRHRLLSEAEQLLVDMRPFDKATGSGEVQLLSPQLKELLNQAKLENRNSLVIVNRRGLAPVTLCRDCGQILFCDNCASPLVLHERKTAGASSERIFVCHKCQETYPARRKCGHCGSWNLKALGVGLEAVLEKIKDQVRSAKIFRFDSDSVRSAKEASKTAADFYRAAGAILVGTEMVLNYLSQPLEYAAVASIDNIFAIPDFNNSVRLFRLLIKIRELATKKFLVQTRHPEAKVFEYALKGNILEFYRAEEELRKRFGYPPFSMLIKISRQGRKETVRMDMKRLESLLAPWRPIIIPAFIPKIKNVYRQHAILKVKRESWPDPKLSALLKSLSPAFSVNVEPENLL